MLKNGKEAYTDHHQILLFRKKSLFFAFFPFLSHLVVHNRVMATNKG